MGQYAKWYNWVVRVNHSKFQIQPGYRATVNGHHDMEQYLILYLHQSPIFEISSCIYVFLDNKNIYYKKNRISPGTHTNIMQDQGYWTSGV